MLRKFFVAAAIATGAIWAKAIEPGEYIAAGDPSLEWSQFDEKNSKCMLTGKGLELESRKDKSSAITTCELPFNIKDDFRVDLTFKTNGLDDSRLCGIVFDFENDSNYSMLLFGKKNFQLLRCSKGDISVIHKGLFKSKNKVLDVTVEQAGNKLSFALDGMNLMTRRNVTLQYPVFGFITCDKSKLLGQGIRWKSVIRETEEE